MNRFLTGLLLLLAPACASFGNRISEEDLAKLEPGMTTEEVVKIVGPPTMRVSIFAGVEQWTYTWSSAWSVGYYTSANSHSLSLYFKDGKLNDPPTQTPQGKMPVELDSRVHVQIENSKHEDGK